MVAISNKIALGAGCYWGTEKFVVKDFQKKFPGAIKDAKVGFMSPDPNAMANPSYRQVCSGETGHVEVLMIELADPTTSSSSTSTTCTSTEELVEALLRFFFQFHDPTTKDRQGNDAGTQYASAIFCADEAQKKIAQSVKEELQQLIDNGKISSSAYARKTVETYIADLQIFYPAHEEHQEYLMKNPNGYCNHRYYLKEWPVAIN